MSKSEKVKVKILRTHPEFSGYIGETIEISREAFDRISQHGPFFEEVAAEKASATAVKQAEPDAKEAEKAPKDGPKQRKHTR